MSDKQVLLAVDMDDFIKRHRGRRQQLMSQLSRQYKVVYVDKMNSFIHSFRKYGWKFGKYLEYGVYTINENLIFVRLPHIFLPFANAFRFVNHINCWIMGFFISNIRKKLSINNIHVLWVGHPYAGDMKLESDMLVYDCFDEHSGFRGIFRSTAVKDIEKDLIVRSNLTIFSAQHLSDQKEIMANKSIVIRNGSDYDHFYMDPHKSLLNDNSILYSGVISDWVDIELIKYLVRNMPDFIFRFVGPVRKNWLDSIKTLNNVDIVGEVPYEELPEYYCKAAACIIPFDPTWELIKSTNPIKLYEYLASGKPTVSTRFYEVEKCSHYLSLADSHDEFKSHLLETIRNNNYESVLKRQEFAKSHSWESRKESIVSAISNEAITFGTKRLNRKNV